ncbi:MAG: metallophosphoesterase family protein [Paracoccaceae bacterium]
MRIRELGHLDQPVILFGGPYSNVQATQAILIEADKRAIPGTHQICTGDVVAYCGKPNETVDLIRASGCAVVAGNCEKQLASRAADCGCGFDEGSACDMLSGGWYQFANTHLSGSARDWMQQLPDVAVFWHRDKRFAVIHGGHTDIARFIWPVTADDVFDQEWAALESSVGAVDAVISGHCGLAFTKHTKHGRWVNAGVIGMPPNEGHKDTRFAILENGNITHHILSYDVQAAQRDMQKAGLSQGYDNSLISGYWPSEDVLPPDLRRSAALASG